MPKRVDKNAQCPYYRRDEGVKLVCEGITDGMVTVNLVFDGRPSLLKHRQKHCIRCWRQCPIKKLIDQKWGYVDPGGIPER